MTRHGGLLLLLAAAACSTEPTVAFEIPDATGRWYKGNTHTHTDRSDGDSPPRYVANWYKNHGYAFLVLSDHNVFTDPATLEGVSDSTFLLIPGEEVTSSFEGASVHVNALDIPHIVEARRAQTLVATIQANVDAVREVGGVPHINHPNFQWSFGAEELRQVERDRLLEIWNGHPTVHNLGGGGTPGLEEVWDVLLKGGKRVYGIAVDDAHHFQGEFAPGRANPGRGWVEVRAPSLDARALVQALEAGHFYASTGVELDDVRVSGDRLEVYVREQGDFRYTTSFIGAEGRILGRTHEDPAVYTLAAAEPYVRAKVVRSDGAAAWVQPTFTRPR